MPLRLEDLKPDAQVTGQLGREAVRIVSAQMMGEACDLVFRDGQGNLQSQILFRDKEADLDLVACGRKWSFQGKATSFGWSQRASGSAWPTSLIPTWLSAAAPSTRCPTRSARSTSTCCRANPCGTCWRTTQGLAKRSWPAC